jgi:predicted transcriptional regulator
MKKSTKATNASTDAKEAEMANLLSRAEGRPQDDEINAASDSHIDSEVLAYQDALVLKGLDEMSRGRLLDHAEVWKRLRKKMESSKT